MKRISLLIVFSLATIIPSVSFADWRGNSWKHNRHGSCNEHPRYSFGNRGNSFYQRDFRFNGARGFHQNNSMYQRGVGERIQFGARSGELSSREVRDLREDAAKLERQRMRYASDGVISHGERKSLRNGYKDLRKDLKHELNDGERRW